MTGAIEGLPADQNLGTSGHGLIYLAADVLQNALRCQGADIRLWFHGIADLETGKFEVEFFEKFGGDRLVENKPFCRNARLAIIHGAGHGAHGHSLIEIR